MFSGRQWSTPGVEVTSLLETFPLVAPPYRLRLAFRCHHHDPCFAAYYGLRTSSFPRPSKCGFLNDLYIFASFLSRVRPLSLSRRPLALGCSVGVLSFFDLALLARNLLALRWICTTPSVFSFYRIKFVCRFPSTFYFFFTFLRCHLCPGFFPSLLVFSSPPISAGVFCFRKTSSTPRVSSQEKVLSGLPKLLVFPLPEALFPLRTNF